ncbi:hypothetical protein [Inhella crocodyli]|uniref:Uncharacterized protein n=1 Tax=Inhella crocodyli TaxID=2499851 RepID=A0A3S2UIG9_9BURK|nr:hypothetical protein [Inhella crocodyli]RVT88559.1 hypothetical protein EOD73_06205 [Inhella crocodyli]
MARRTLPACHCPLTHRRWQALRFDGESWFLLPRAPGADELPLSAVAVVLDTGSTLWLRVQWHGGRWAWWPGEQHLWLRRGRVAVDWPVLRAALALQRRWLGDARRSSSTPG